MKRPLNPQQRIFVGLGGNFDGTPAVLLRAIGELNRSLGVEPTALSSWYNSEPWGGQTTTAFVNAVVEYRSTLDAHQLLDVLSSVEHSLGRRRALEVRWGDRIVDLDLLAVGDRQINRPGLHVPHPRLTERRFVLQPWAEIAPNFVLPNVQTSVAELLKRCPDQSLVRRSQEAL